MPFAFNPHEYTTDPQHFSEKGKETIEQMRQPGTTKILIGRMSLRPGLGAVIYFHRRVGLVMCMVMGGGEDGNEMGFQGLKNAEESINKMLLYVDNIGQTDPDSIPEMQLIRGHMFGAFNGSAEDMQSFARDPNSLAKFYAVGTAAELPRFNIDFFQAVIEKIDKDARASELDHSTRT